MAVFDLLSKRVTDAARAGDVDVYQYSDIPKSLRVQIKQIALESIGQSVKRGDNVISTDQQNPWWLAIEQTYQREKGLEHVGSGKFAGDRVLDFMFKCPTEEWLDCLDLIAVTISKIAEKKQPAFCKEWRVTLAGVEAKQEINYRLRTASVGYQIEQAQLMRVDSQYVHAEIVKPALQLISGKQFKGPEDEFLKAHEHYRKGEYRPAITMAANALESTLKAVLEAKGWPYKKGARISDLLKVAHEKSLWPDYLDNSFDQLTAVLKSGLPEIRNNLASHGQGSTPSEVPGYIAAFALHLAASKIVFIVEAAKT